jgi:hypothetical protein
LGLLCGYLLWSQWLQLPNELIQSVLSAAGRGVKAIEGAFAFQLPYAFLLSLFTFITAIPNTLLIAGAAGLFMRRFGGRRQLMYGALVWPILVYIALWLELSHSMRVAERVGIDPALAAYSLHQDYPARALLILFIYSAFFSLAFLISRAPGASSIQK